MAVREGKKNSNISDLVTMGVFIALYFVLLTVCGMTMSAVPLIMVLMPLIFGLLGGLIFSVLLGKVQRPGAFLITSVLMGVFLISMAPGGTMCYFTIIGGVLGELIYHFMGRKSFKSISIAYAVYMVFFGLGEYIPFVWMKEQYLALYANQGATVEVAKAGTELLNPLVMVLLLIGTAVCAVLGCLWGRVLTRKQFERAGIV